MAADRRAGATDLLALLRRDPTAMLRQLFVGEAIAERRSERPRRPATRTRPPSPPIKPREG